MMLQSLELDVDAEDNLEEPCKLLLDAIVRPLMRHLCLGRECQLPKACFHVSEQSVQCFVGFDVALTRHFVFLCCEL